MIKYEEYKEKVVKEFKELWPNLSDEKVKEYFSNNNEGEEVCQEDYKRHVKELESGKITEKVLMNGCVGSTAYELSLLY